MPLELYPASAHDAFHGTGLQYPAHIDEAVQQIYGACKGLGTDEQTLITVLGSKSPETRNLIALRYKELYHQPLQSLAKSETSGDFGRLLRMISTPLPETEAQILRDATKGIGTTESLIVQILSGRSNEEMNILKRSYFDLVNKDLAVTLNSELSGDFRKVVMAVLQSPQAPYNPAVHNAAKAEEEAIALYKAGQGRLGTNEEVFIGILVKTPPELLKMMDAVYVAKYNNNIAKAVDKEFSGDAKKSLNYLVRSTLDPYPAIAEVFEKTMKGFGTDETGLSTALVRYQSVLPYVKAAYKKQYHEELRDRISGETSGDYKKLLLEVFDAPHDPPRSKVKGAQGAAPSSGLGAVPIGSGAPAYLSTQTSYAAPSGGFNAAPAGAGPPPYLSTQTSYAASSASLPSSSQGYTASPAYPTPAGQQSYGQPAVGQAEYGVQTPTSQPGGYPPQTPTSQPSSGSSYPATQPQGQSPGYPSPQQQPGYPPQQPQQSSYPPQQQYPQPGSGYPSQQQQPQQPPQQPGYPHQQQPGYPPQQPGYPSQQQQYPPQQPQAGYGAPQHSGYQQPQQGYPPQQQQSGYPTQQPGYPASQPSYPQQQPAYPSQQPGYPSQQPGYPPQQPGYPQPSYPPQQQQPGYPPQQYPPPAGQPGYPPQYGAGPPHQGGGYPPSGYPPSHQQQYPAPGGYPPYRGA